MPAKEDWTCRQSLSNFHAGFSERELLGLWIKTITYSHSLLELFSFHSASFLHWSATLWALFSHWSLNGPLLNDLCSFFFDNILFPERPTTRKQDRVTDMWHMTYHNFEQLRVTSSNVCCLTRHIQCTVIHVENEQIQRIPNPFTVFLLAKWNDEIIDVVWQTVKARHRGKRERW